MIDFFYTLSNHSGYRKEEHETQAHSGRDPVQRVHHKDGIEVISGYTGRHLDRAYKLAVEKDKKDLYNRLTYSAGEKIRLTTACWVMGTNLDQLQKIKADAATSAK